jgi:3-dehydroquinate synthetase
LWQDRAALQKLFESRREAYADCDLMVKTDQKSPARVVEEVMAAWLPQESFTVSLNGDRVLVTATGQGPQVLAPLVEGRRVALLTDRKVGRLHLERYREVLGDPLVMSVAPGERSKSLATSQRLYQSLLDARLGRGDLLVALGGGMITDLGAWVAATYKRGMDCVLASTSLLGCVDAAVGGKAAVNLGPAKNMVGCFTQPRAVILDLAALATLDRRQRVEGLVEAYKTGLAASPKLTQVVQSGRDRLLGGYLEGLAQVVTLSARAKGQVVARDFREAGLRRILNLGHTYGHAVEGHTRFQVSHGQAVAVGIMAAAAISRQRGLLAEGLERDIHDTLAPLAPPAGSLPSAREAWPLMTNDKKNMGGRVMYVLLQEPGSPLWVEDVTPKELAEALAKIGKLIHG